MKIAILILVIAFGVGCNSQRHCMCSREFVPVCGSNGETYSNICNFHCAQEDYKMKGINLVLKECNHGINRIIGCRCSTEYKPVCGLNDKVYPNLCGFNCDQKAHKGYIFIQRNCTNADFSEDKIEKERSLKKSCACPNEQYLPICDTKGNFYSHLCQFNCVQNKLLFQGEKIISELCTDLHYKNNRIEQEKVEKIEKTNAERLESRCLCNKKYSPICDLNNNVYINWCEFRCAQVLAGEKGITISEKKCSKEITSDTNQFCKCSDTYSPVCDVYNVVFKNSCEFKCNKYKVLLKERLVNFSEKKCDYAVLLQQKQKQLMGHCNCAGEHETETICTQKGTYLNKCTFECDKKLFAKTEGIVLTREDCNLNKKYVINSEETYSHIKKNTDCTSCPNDYNPVCGSDNIMYTNECTFNCFKNVLQKHNIFINKVNCVKTPLQIDNGPEEIYELKLQQNVPTTLAPKKCLCSEEFNPVCGTTNLVNYTLFYNRCEFLCSGEKYMQKCIKQNVKIEDRPCLCSTEIDLVCGTNNVMYLNKCQLNCVKNKQKTRGRIIMEKNCTSIFEIPETISKIIESKNIGAFNKLVKCVSSFS